MKVKILVLLGCLVMILLSADISEMRIVGKSEKTTDIVSAKYQTVNRERAACIIFVTDLEVELDFRPNGQLVAAVQEAPGQWNVYVAPFERRIDVYAYGYKPLIVVLREFGVQNLQGSDVYRLQLTGDKPDVRSIENINIAVQATPRNAVIYLNNEKVEDSRQVLAKVGKNSLKIELIGYKTIIEEIEVSEQRTFFEFQMELEINLPVEVSTEPSDANLFINDISIGSTPARFFYRTGKHKLRLVKEGYTTVEEEIEITAPQAIKSYKLQDIRGTLTIKTNPNAAVYLNDQHYPQGVSNLKVNPQMMGIRVVAPKANDINRNVIVREREHQVLELFPTINSGSIRVEVIPIDADILLVGDAGERYSSKGIKTFRDIPIGNYQLEIQVEQNTHRESIDLKKDEFIRKQIVFNLKGAANEGVTVNEQRTSDESKLQYELDVPVEITTIPAGVAVTIDDVSLGKTPVRFFYKAGRYQIRITDDSYRDVTEWIELKEPQTVKSYRLEDIRGTLTIKTGNTSKVFINDKEYPHGVNNLKLPPQLAGIKIVTPKADDILRSVEIREKQNYELELLPEIKTGTVRVDVMPENARVLLMGDEGERFTSPTNETFQNVPVGKYQLEIKAEGHKTHKESFDLQEDGVVRKQVILQAGSDGIEMVLVEGGTFQMGSTTGDYDEKPVHSVTVSSFYIGKYEVTQEQWRSVMSYIPSEFRKKNVIRRGFLGIGRFVEWFDNLDNPVERISWYDTVEYCNKLSLKERLTPVYSINGNHSPANWRSGTITVNWSANGYRLPTEAEWEYAARGGNKSKDYTYSGGNNVGDVAWYRSNSGKKTNPVGRKTANELGIYDMSGNVFEWCWDWYDRYAATAQTNPRGQSSGSHRVFRGGGWINSDGQCTVSFRSYSTPSNSRNNLGFRLSKSIP